MLKLIIFLSLIGLLRTSAQIIQDGQCNPDIALQQNFNIDNFVGDWYEVSRTDNPHQEGECTRLSLTQEEGVISIRYEAVNRNFYEQIPGTVTQEGETARLSLNLNGFSDPINFWVLLTDHSTYALTYNCININENQRAVYVWQLGRSQTFSELLLALMNTSLNNLLGITLEDLKRTDFSDGTCYELPVIEENQPVVLPGLCDTNIPVVQNIDVLRFTGLWHEISSYYSESALGTCARAEYTLVGGVVNVENSQVVNQTLEKITGTATVSDADGHGKLSVTLEVAPGVFADQELWVLATDYNDYAVLYSCVDQPNNQKRVYSWISSRTRVQSAAAQAAVTELIDSIIELNAVYYDSTDQSDDGCFYFPEHVADQPVQFRGQCDMGIPAMANFDAVRYMGLWHEIESYPSVFQTGTCNNAHYTLDTELGIVDVFNTQVINQQLDTINGNAIIAEDANGTGKLVVTFPIAGTNLTTSTDYWVLDTDYDNYALVYTCYNIEEDTRGVWSWKLSRQKFLNAESDAAIDAVVATIPVLDERYYQSRDQSVNGCFYFPEPEQGIPVVFPGQCDEGIAVVPNFNLNDFQGIWHEIEAYPKTEQNGDCINHYFTQGTGNTLNLQSSQIENQFLTVSSGNVAVNSSDGSARLVITVDLDGQVIEIPYWILSTDYTDYALAYSCLNLNSDFRGIWSWKLSRTKQLSAAASTAIDETMSNIDVLGNPYYDPVDQSDPACFYLPELEPGEPVVIVGQCQADIAVVQNFDMERFSGRWRRIESYPDEYRNGTCHDKTYGVDDDGSLWVQYTHVDNERLESLSGWVDQVGNEGKIRVTLNTGEPTREYWILDTDYNTFAFLYACENVDTERRRVWSWKMSRTRELSEAATATINEIINNIDVLNSRFFEEINNSDAGCFYYPWADNNPVQFRGQCDETISVVTGFDANRYMGLWYDVESYPQEFQDGTCATATYVLDENGVEVYNTQVINETLDYIYGRAVVDNDIGEAKLVVTFPIAGTEFTIDSPYWVLDTDYENYALVYACVNLGADSRRVSSWKLSRQKTLSAASEAAIEAAVNNVQVLSEQYYLHRDHTEAGCFYYPEVTGEPLRFRGQCDDSIQAVPNFDLNRFSGVWHETAAYPKDQQDGQCVNYAFDATSANTLGLYTTQVIDLYLDETNATVVQTATDNSARFTITITNSDGNVVEIPYWILATDYDNYAVAYSCVNIDENYRGVWSWKLSRNKQISEASENAIAEAISDIQVLEERYYQPTSQSDDSCFYLPVLGPQDPVVFVGQCDPGIQVIQNFDPTRYEGRWRLIESYYSEFQTGTCNDATYTIQGDGSVLVYNTQVIGEALDTITGSAVLATADGSGKLLVTFPGAPELLEYWILDTDYESYAIVYSCANLNPDQRQVWSWKLSRTTNLTDDARTAIDEIVHSVNVLDERYYSEMIHTEEACFYFPEPDGNPVTFRGTCDDSISVVQNFDIEAYMGLWYDIESYPQAFQDGACPTATYTLTGDGVLVYNTQVVRQLLDTVNATAVPAGDDGQAKLIVTFPVAGTDLTLDVPYWVLATDYTSYALVYSCSQVNEEYRSVTSWKLSRTPELTQAAQIAINAAINEVQVLANPYYNKRGHTEEDCFYYPDNFGGPVVLDGQCEDQNVVENFNINMFAGTWHETARFPSNLQTGECAANEFVVNQNSFILTQTIVSNERLTTVSGPAVVVDDGRGIFTATLQNDEGVSVEVTINVLETDYTEYALLFSCVAIDESSKQIYSWKLSRSRSGLSQAANDLIDEAVDRNVDLHEIYYEYTDQSNDGCFYYPVFEELPAAIELPGPCYDRIQAKANFEPAAYLGRWFEISKYPQRDQIGECSRAHYSLGQGDALVDVMNTIVFNQTLEIREGTADLLSTDGSGVLWVTFPLENGVIAETNYYVLETDYNSFALVYSCRDLDNGNSEVYSWKLSRTPTLSDAANAIIDGIISNTRGLLEEYYTPTSQTDKDCFYIPDVTEDAVLFRGQCESVSGVEGFDVSQYVGWWHEIERYPTDHDVGDCTSSQYSTVGNTIHVVDTSVTDLTGHITTGTVVASNNGVLTRTLSNGQVEELVVLATDYQTYSLLYSCSNTEDGEYRRVWSAKYSKTRELTEAAENAMAPIIETNQVLYPKFYLPVDQSDEACFHYPPPTGEKVILPGQCDDNIPTVNNFDPIEYTGTWYLIERYPYPEVSADGTCAGSRYTYDEGTGEISVTNWEVVDGELNSVEGTAIADGAKLTVTLPVEGSNDTTTTELRILQTDYVAYSLAYTCNDVNPFQREVVAFKLSRTRTLPAAAVTAINNYMASRPELHQPYFVSVEQEEACPEPSSAFLLRGSVVVLLVAAVLQLFM